MVNGVLVPDYTIVSLVNNRIFDTKVLITLINIHFQLSCKSVGSNTLLGLALRKKGQQVREVSPAQPTRLVRFQAFHYLLRVASHVLCYSCQHSGLFSISDWKGCKTRSNFSLGETFCNESTLFSFKVL